MIKDGKYAIYKGKEYSIIIEDGYVTLRSFDQSELKNGFRVGGLLKNVYLKDVSINELEDAYEIIPYCIYKGYDFGIIGYSKEKQTVTIVTSNPKAKEKLNLESPGKGEYIKKVPIQDIQIFEEKRPLFGFRNKQ
ncbi:hypothetical protein [Fictibacillus gelatini]|uniref:hypothetical protein n=1 Tax=Fictibacillus gelatini TaxID=225985 RepID=UPI00040B86AB|nr:hypothetical protein [Fictibacillus gelatini]